MEYADVVWDGCTLNKSELLETIQYDAGQVITGAMKRTSRIRLLLELRVGWKWKPDELSPN